MRIIIDARESGTSTGRYVDKLIEYLYKLKPEYEITILTKSERLDFFKDISPSFEVVQSDYKEFTFAEQTGLLGQLRGLKNDLVHFTMPQQPVLYSGKSITTFHDLTTTRFNNPSKNWLVFSLKQRVYKWLIRRVAHKSKYLIAISEFVKKDVEHFAKVAPNKIFVTYEAADKISAKSEPIKNLVDTKFILYVGRPQPHKNLERLIEAFRVIQQSHPDLKLVLGGKKDVLYERLEKLTQKKGIEGVVFTGFVSEGQLRWLYENTAAYTFPSLSEGFGLPALEAMAHGAPVVSSSTTSLPEIYGHAAHYFDPTDTSDMAARIIEVLEDSKLRAKLIAAGAKHANIYSWEIMAKQTLELYDKALSPNT